MCFQRCLIRERFVDFQKIRIETFYYEICIYSAHFYQSIVESEIMFIRSQTHRSKYEYKSPGTIYMSINCFLYVSN